VYFSGVVFATFKTSDYSEVLNKGHLPVIFFTSASQPSVSATKDSIDYDKNTNRHSSPSTTLIEGIQFAGS
jgi:endonuclease V-like protein UPF0215 family